MPFRRVDMGRPDVPGALWLDAMPGRFEPWSDFLAAQRRAAIALVLCLTPREEVALGAPCYHRAVVEGKLPFRWLHAPMRNFGLPLDLPAFRDAVEQAARALHAGDAVLLHCAAGLGRTGTAAACVLKQLGLPRDEALARVRAAGSNPQNAEQSGLVDLF
jgi:protein-tyrosine phosphatase